VRVRVYTLTTPDTGSDQAKPHDWSGWAMTPARPGQARLLRRGLAPKRANASKAVGVAKWARPHNTATHFTLFYFLVFFVDHI
jgi:hypothetical protein